MTSLLLLLSCFLSFLPSFFPSSSIITPLSNHFPPPPFDIPHCIPSCWSSSDTLPLSSTPNRHLSLLFNLSAAQIFLNALSHPPRFSGFRCQSLPPPRHRPDLVLPQIGSFPPFRLSFFPPPLSSTLSSPPFLIPPPSWFDTSIPSSYLHLSPFRCSCTDDPSRLTRLLLTSDLHTSALIGLQSLATLCIRDPAISS